MIQADPSNPKEYRMKAKKLTRETIRDLGVTERNFPAFEVGDVIAISQRIVEGDKSRLQVFEGDVIACHHNGAASTFTVRKISADSVSVERIFPYYTPVIEAITLVRKGQARRAKLYYMRKRVGKAARVQEKVMTREQREQKEAAQTQKSN
jgi:large subunit ribosomal protein L19